MDRKTEILEQLIVAGFPNKEVAVSVEDFFKDNQDIGSIGCNIYPDPPSLQTFYDTFKTMLISDKVENILVRIADAEDSEWFHTDTVYVIGDVTLEEITEMLKELKPDEIYSNWMYGKPVNISNESTDKMIYSIWWD
jgi:hypothetical protein